MLTGRTLTVVASADNNAVSGGLGPLRESGITDLKAEFTQVRNVGAVRQDLGTGRHDMVGGNVIAHLQNRLRRQLIRKCLGFGELLDIGTTQDFHIRSIFRRCQYRRIVNAEAIRQLHRLHSWQSGRIGYVSGQSRCNCRFRRYQIDLTVLGAAPSKEIAIECTKAHTAGIGREPHTDARAAGALQKSCAAGKDIRQCATLGKHSQHLLRTGRNG